MSVAENRMIGFEATALDLNNISGVGQYAWELLNALTTTIDEWCYTVLARNAPKSLFPQRVAVLSVQSIGIHSLWMQLALPRLLERIRPRLCHFTNYVAPLASRFPFVVTVHDMSLFLYPRMLPRKSLWLVRSLLPTVTARASAVITVSESAKRDIVSVLRLPSEKVHAIHAAAGDRFRRMDQANLDKVRRKYGLEDPFILSVGTIEPRKNLSRLISAYKELRLRGRREHLVLVGQLGWHYGPMLRQIENSGLSRCVRLLGYVPSEDLPAIYGLATVSAFPSLYEGFGLPIIESMACETPVLTSKCAATSETAGGAALLVDPLKEEEIESGLLCLLTDATLRGELREKGIARALQFSWSRAASETSAVYRKIDPRGN